MDIVIDRISDGRFRGVLLIDGDEQYTAIEKRPGCCARTIMNYLSMTYGAPEGTIQLSVEGW